MRVLLLAGTRDARHIAAALGRFPRLLCVASLPRAERRPVSLGIPTRIGAFSSQDILRDWLISERITAIIDATDPFSETISNFAHAAAADLGIDYSQFLRPAWLPERDDKWTFLNNEAEAERHIAPGQTVFLATGQRGLEGFVGLDKNQVFIRLTDRIHAPFPFTDGGYIFGIPPFSLDQEFDTLASIDADWLVARNTGDFAERTTLEAARLLGLNVAMIRRPPQPLGPKANTVAEVVAWVRRRM